MKRPLKNRFPLESFDPRFRNIWLRGVLGEVRIEFETKKEAQAFQARLQMYRMKLKEANDPQIATLYRAKTSLRDNVLLIQPADTAYVSVLKEFNAPVKDTAIPSLTPELPDLDTSTSKPLSIDDIFSDLPTEGDSHE